MSHSPATSSIKELTIRGIIIGGIITVVFTAANVYLGLKAGITFATSIPAAVISMAILRRFADHTVQENNIVQTIASAAGTLSSIIFVLPGLIIIGWWSGFPYWTTVFIIILGGILGVTYSIPLRRALVTHPEGVAGAEVLRVGDTTEGAEESQRGFRMILRGSLASAGLSLLSSLKAIGVEISSVFKVGAGATMFSTSLSMALIGVGHLVGIAVGVAMILGLVISYGVMLPIRTWGQVEGVDELQGVVSKIFSTDVRFIGAGAIAIAAIWTFVKILGPIVKGIGESLAKGRGRVADSDVPLTERDLSMKVVVGITLGSMLPIGVLMWLFLKDTGVANHAWGLILVSILFILITGLAVASVCGYMAGLIGSSNSPISGVGILAALAAAVLVKAVASSASGDETSALVAYTLFTSAVVFSIASISNDNLQDLKTGQLVRATPWKQQVALVIGVAFGSVIIPPVLHLLNTSFGFAGAPNATDNALAAPQAALLSSLAKGVFGGDLSWGLLGLGAAVGAVVVVIDEVLGRATRNRMHLPPLAVGMGMYLPMGLTLIIPVGAVAGLLYDRWAAGTADPESARRLSTLAATGLIVGESLFGVILAGIVAASGEEDPLAVVGSGFTTVSEALGALVFAGMTLGLYLWVRRLSVRATGARTRA